MPKYQRAFPLLMFYSSPWKKKKKGIIKLHTSRQLFKDQTNSLKIPEESQPGAESALNDASGIKMEDGRKRKRKVPNQSTLTKWKRQFHLSLRPFIHP
jgi:hypothetical protein